MNYNWGKILENYSDSDLYKALTEPYSPSEKKETAEKILLERRVIVKNANGSYEKEVIDAKFLKQTEKLSKSMSKENVLNILVQNGLDEESSRRIIEYYYIWKVKQKKRQIPWMILFFVAFAMETISEVVKSLNFLTSTIGVILFIALLGFLGPILFGSGFSNIKMFKVLVSKQ